VRQKQTMEAVVPYGSDAYHTSLVGVSVESTDAYKDEECDAATDEAKAAAYTGSVDCYHTGDSAATPDVPST